MRLTERDFRLLSWIGEQFIINKCELTELLVLDAEKHHLELGEHVTAGIISRWKRYGLVKSFHQLQRGSHLYLTGQGIQNIGLSFQAKTPGRSAFSHLTHHDVVNQLRLHLERRAWLHKYQLLWLSERRLLQQERSTNGEYVFERRLHRPDALITEDGVENIALEVERTYKRPKRLQAILNDYVYHPTYSQVRYYCSNHKIYQNVQRALKVVLADTPLIHQPNLQQKVCLQMLPFDDKS
jgi:hypothetical protein